VLGPYAKMAEMSAPAPRTWIVELSAKAGFRFDGREQITVVASPESTIPVHGVRLRNGIAWGSDDHSEGAPTYVGSFVAEAAGRFASKEEAVAVLGNLASPYFQVLAVISNAAVDEPEDIVAYAPPAGPDDTGEFVVQRHSQLRSPAARLRKVAAPPVMSVIHVLTGHPRQDRLHRAMAHFRQALNQLNPENRVLSAESLWMVVENLTRVVFDRLCRERDIDPSAQDAKHQLAVAMGLNPKKLEVRSETVQALIDSGRLDPKSLKRDNSHLDALDSHIRLEILMGGDKPCYKQLREMSDGFEHGYMAFGDVREKSRVADAAFGHLRRAILNEIGLDGNSPLFDERFDDPQGVWRPIFEGHGGYTDSSGKTVDLSPATFNEPWPDAPGLSLVPWMKAVVDNPDGTRTMTLEVNGTTTAMPETQTVSLRSSKWISPSGKDGKLIDRETTVRLNGEVVEDAFEVPPEPSPDDS
jgi:hypothetical protein